MTIMIIDDSIRKTRKIEKELKEKNVSFITVYAINTARQILKNGEKIDGIVLDMQLPIYHGDKKSMKNDGGITFLKWLDHYGYKIPVLGNSMQEFKTEYRYFEGQMLGVYDPEVFEKFLSSIKDHS